MKRKYKIFGSMLGIMCMTSGVVISVASCNSETLAEKALVLSTEETYVQTNTPTTIYGNVKAFNFKANELSLINNNYSVFDNLV
jgi:hypothetical protein